MPEDVETVLIVELILPVELVEPANNWEVGDDVVEVIEDWDDEDSTKFVSGFSSVLDPLLESKVMDELELAHNARHWLNTKS